MNPCAFFSSAAQSWEELPPFDAVAFSEFVSNLALQGPVVHETDVPVDFVGDEDPVSVHEAFVTPAGPWTDVSDAVAAFTDAADKCAHRFKICHYSGGHHTKNGRVNDWKYFYCCCNKPPTESAVKHHAKSYCTFDARIKLDKKTGQWNVYGKPTLEHCCQPLPDLSITATGMRLLRTLQELTEDEVKFIEHQFEFVGVIPRVIQYNFSRAFKDRKPTGELISRMRVKYRDGVYGFQSDHVEQLLKDVRRFKDEGGIGEVAVDQAMKISRLTVVRPDMMPFLKKYSRVVICDATHGISMTGFKLFTVVCVDALMHSALVAYSFIRSESADDLISIFNELRPHLGSNVVFISDDNPAAALLCRHFGFTHLLCQWHYAKSFVKNCKANRVSTKDFPSFAKVFADLLRGTNFSDRADLENQLKHFAESVELQCPAMRNWLKEFSKDREIVCEYFRKDIYTAG